MLETKILIIDSSRSDREFVSDYLKKDETYVVDDVESFHEAIQVIKLLDEGNNYDVIIMGLGVHPQEGVNFIKVVNKRYSKIPIILIPDIEALKFSQKEISKCVIFDILCKPINLEFLELVVSIALNIGNK